MRNAAFRSAPEQREYLRIGWKVGEAYLDEWPAVLYHELDLPERVETRRIEVYPDGWVGGARIRPEIVDLSGDDDEDAAQEITAVQLVFPTRDRIAAEPGITEAAQVSRGEFERLWARANIDDEPRSEK